MQVNELMQNATKICRGFSTSDHYFITGFLNKNGPLQDPYGTLTDIYSRFKW